MKQFSKAMLVGLVSVALLGQAAAVMAAQHEEKRPEQKKELDYKDRDYKDQNGKDKYKDRRWCDRHAKVKIRDLDADPKWFWDGGRIKRWYVYAYLESRDYCYANVSLWNDRDLVARERNYRLEPGRNKIELEPEHRFRFSKHEHCFDVYFNLKGNRWKVDADRTFCAREKRAWTLDEYRGDGKGKGDYKRR